MTFIPDCLRCDGSGKVTVGHVDVDCPACGGSGQGPDPYRLTKREQIAAMVLQGTIPSVEKAMESAWLQRDITTENFSDKLQANAIGAARQSVIFADALIAELEKDKDDEA